MLCKIILAAVAICATPCAIAQTQPTYFLIDASGSMGDRLQDSIPQADGKLLTTKQELAEARFKQLLDELSDSAFVSKNYFSGICGQSIQVSPATAKAYSSPVAPPPPTADTPIAEALEAALNAVGGEPATIVLITDGGQSCGARASGTRDLCSVAFERLPGQHNVSVRVEFAGASDADKASLRCIDDAQQRQPAASDPSPEQQATALNSGPLAPSKQSGGNQDRGTESGSGSAEVTLVNSLPWTFLALLFALSFIMLGRSFADAHRHLEQKLRTVDDDAAKGNFVDFSKQKPKYGLPATIFIVAFIASFVVLWGSGDLIAFARSGAANALNNEFGAAVFLAGLMTLGVFASSQYWRYSELRAKYGLASNEADRNKKARDDAARRRQEAKEEQERDRLEAAYDAYRAVFAGREYSFDKYLVEDEFAAPNLEALSDVVEALKFLAAGPRPSRSAMSKADIDHVWKLSGLWAGRSPQALLDSIPAARLPDATRAELRDFFYRTDATPPLDQNAVLQKLRRELELLVTQHSTSP